MKMEKKIFITGSNASMLSIELGTHLTGRNIEINLYPYSFKEYLSMKQKIPAALTELTTIERSILKSQFNAFMNEGGLPEYVQN